MRQLKKSLLPRLNKSLRTQSASKIFNTLPTFSFAKNPRQKGWDLEILQLSSTWKGYIFRSLEQIFIGPLHKINPKGQYILPSVRNLVADDPSISDEGRVWPALTDNYAEHTWPGATGRK
uniref:Uncharacterized protein n=1 Tax=Ursus americanus TaxID=9643 RepID=A0A452QI50_URSAM